MSELQIGLLAIGAVVVACVLVYNRVQEGRARRDAERNFRSGHEDVLLGDALIGQPLDSRGADAAADGAFARHQLQRRAPRTLVGRASQERPMRVATLDRDPLLAQRSERHAMFGGELNDVIDGRIGLRRLIRGRGAGRVPRRLLRASRHAIRSRI